MIETLADLYLRLSLDHPGATAIERQEDECRRWCTADGLTVRQVHIDRGVCGYRERSQHKRDGFVAALGAVASGEITTLVVWKLDRLSRRGIGQVGPLLDDLEPAIPANRRDLSLTDLAYLIFLLARSRRVRFRAAGSRRQGRPQAARRAWS